MPDLALRRWIARLQSLPPADFDAILDSLDTEQRARTLALLAEFQGEKAAAEDVDVIAVALPPGISPWLVSRINGRGDAGEETDDPFDMTTHARTELRSCAAQFMEQPKIAKRGPPLLARLIEQFS